MASKADIKVVCVPPDMLEEAWPHVGPLLLKGQLEMTGNMRQALRNLAGGLVEVLGRKVQVWAVCDDGAKRVLAAMASEIVVEDGRKVVWVTGMGGEKITRWGKPLSDRMAAFAKAEGCEAVRFAGRPALQRAYGSVRCVGEYGDGLLLFERVAL